MATRRVRIDRSLDPLDVLRRVRGRDRVVALLGQWHHGEALIAWDPVAVLDDPFELDVPRGDEAPEAFGGGWIGVWGYPLGATLEHLPPAPPRPVPLPSHRVAFYDRVLRLSDGQWWAESIGGRPLDDVLAVVHDEPPAPRPYAVGAFTSSPSPDEHRAAVARAIEHVEAGDVFQVNLTTRLEASFAGEPLDAFCAGVEALRPAYAAFVDSPEGAVVSLSPELFLRRTGHEVLTSPIKGTAPLDADVAELVASAKDRAENVMIVDLMRNDLGRVCVPGSVSVPAIARPERHAVWHLVSDVVGRLRADVTDGDLLRATFPPGSVTGAPKVRAMELVHELETTARETYTGAIGHVSPHAGLELNVAIRTFELDATASRIWLGVGGGVVADSTPQGELVECFVKARPLVEVIGGSLAGPIVAEHQPLAARHASTSPDPPVDLDLGVYTTLLVEHGEPLDLAAHLARLDASVRSVYGSTVHAGLESAVRRRAARLTGRHRLRLHAEPVGDDVTVRITTAPIVDDVDAWTLTPHLVVGGQGGHKWADRSRTVDLRAAPDHDLLLLDADGSVLETGRANVFVVLDDGVHTPALDGRQLPGTMRARVLDVLRAAGLPVHQRRLTLDDVRAAHEVFATNALRGAVPVVGVDGVGSWPVGRTTRWLRAMLDGAPLASSGLEVAAGSRPRVLFVDNYDSFVHNLVQYVGELGAEATVVRNDAVTLDELASARLAGNLTHVVISPGPGRPADAGISVDLVRRLGATTPILGVCLGHQAIAEAYGASVVRAPEVVHGKPSLVHHDGLGVYSGLANPFVCARYHSLVVDEATLPPDLVATAHTASGVLMGVRHRVDLVEGVQGHPESILTRQGHDLLVRFLSQARQAGV